MKQYIRLFRDREMDTRGDGSGSVLNEDVISAQLEEAANKAIDTCIQLCQDRKIIGNLLSNTLLSELMEAMEKLKQ